MASLPGWIILGTGFEEAWPTICLCQLGLVPGAFHPPIIRAHIGARADDSVFEEIWTVRGSHWR